MTNQPKYNPNLVQLSLQVDWAGLGWAGVWAEKAILEPFNPRYCTWNGIGKDFIKNPSIYSKTGLTTFNVLERLCEGDAMAGWRTDGTVTMTM